MSGQNDVLLERLRLLNEYVSDLRDLQGLDFDAYTENKLVRHSLRLKLVNMAKFRNLIAHDYAGIDNRIVFEILKGRLRDFVDFSSAIVRYLESDQQ
jgi:uncharacterized protein YutE (UPF0331/DUF86 family)